MCLLCLQCQADNNVDNRLCYKICHIVSYEVSFIRQKNQVDCRGRAETFCPMLNRKSVCTLLKDLSVNKGLWLKFSSWIFKFVGIRRGNLEW